MNRIYKNILIIIAIVILLIIIKKNLVIYEGAVCPGSNSLCFPVNIVETTKSTGKAVAKAVVAVADIIILSADMGAMFASAFAPQPNNV